MARIVFVRALKGYPDSRLEKEVYSLSKKHDVTVFGWDRDEDYRKFRHVKRDVFGVSINFFHVGIIAPVGLGFKKLVYPMLLFWKAEYKFLTLNKDKYDVIHACDFDTAFIAKMIAKKYKKKIVYDIFDYYSESHVAPNLIKKFIKKIDDNLISSCTATIICSELRKEQIKDSEPKFLEVIHNAPFNSNNDEMIQSIIKKGNYDKTKLVYVGLLSQDRYLENIANIINNRNDIEWNVAGWGVLDGFFRKLDSKNIKYYGKISYDEAIILEKSCDLMTAIYDPVLPNHKYAAPNKFYEALMLEKPIIMLKNTGMDTYVQENEIGEVIDISEYDFEQGFNEALDNLIKKRNNWEAMGARGYYLYEKEFSWEKMEERLLELYEKILKTR